MPHWVNGSDTVLLEGRLISQKVRQVSEVCISRPYIRALIDQNQDPGAEIGALSTRLGLLFLKGVQPISDKYNTALYSTVHYTGFAVK